MKTSKIFVFIIVISMFLIPLILQPFDFKIGAEIKGDTINRVVGRDFPSVFQAWNPADKGPGITGDLNANVAKHDLYFTSTQGLGLKWNDSSPESDEDDGRGVDFTAKSISEAAKNVTDLRDKNPRLVILTEIRYWCAWSSYLPEDSVWWQRDSEGKKIVAWQDGNNPPYYYLDWNNVDFRKQVAAQCKAVVDTGVVDGVLIDCFSKDMFGDADNDPNRIDLMKKIREAIGDEYLILVNSNNFTRPNTAKYINGLFMECFNSKTPADWQGISDSLNWAESNLRYPRINCLEVQFDYSRDEPAKMRATTTLGLTQSNGYVLFSDPNSLPVADHLHDWYSFWDTDLGKPVDSIGAQRQNDSMWQREFTNGTVIYNPMGNGDKTVTFGEDRLSAATGKTGKTFMISDYDGDIFTYIAKDKSINIAVFISACVLVISGIIAALILIRRNNNFEEALLV
ncbi:MAG: putative glycoside hydrolase [Saccharofermentanales bacterium]